MKVKFTKDEVVEDHLGNIVQSFQAGEVVELSTASARRWIRRNSAFEFYGESKPEAVKEPEPHPTEKAASGESQESGAALPSASLPAQASVTETSNTSVAPENKDDAASLSSTEHTSEPSGQTSSTAPTRRGGGKRKTRRGSKG